jgi:hypothetical protein
MRLLTQWIWLIHGMPMIGSKSARPSARRRLLNMQHNAACSQAFRREETIQKLLYADGIVSKAGNMPAMSREQAEQLIDEINKR